MLTRNHGKRCASVRLVKQNYAGALLLLDAIDRALPAQQTYLSRVCIQPVPDLVDACVTNISRWTRLSGYFGRAIIE
jgi:hypothetical protein